MVLLKTWLCYKVRCLQHTLAVSLGDAFCHDMMQQKGLHQMLSRSYQGSQTSHSPELQAKLASILQKIALSLVPRCRNSKQTMVLTSSHFGHTVLCQFHMLFFPELSLHVYPCLFSTFIFNKLEV